MTPENFTYWLQGFFELQNPTTLTTQQVGMIKEHLQLCFTKVTSSQSSTSQGFTCGTGGIYDCITHGKAGTSGNYGTSGKTGYDKGF